MRERPGTVATTSCGFDFVITATPVIVWPSITPGGGSDDIILRRPTPTFTPTPISIPMISPNPTRSTTSYNNELLRLFRKKEEFDLNITKNKVEKKIKVYLEIIETNLELILILEEL